MRVNMLSYKRPTLWLEMLHRIKNAVKLSTEGGDYTVW
jgi:hypothetical protein